MSSRMADACDAVVAMVSAIVADPDVAVEVEALIALVPLLEQRAAAAESFPPVRAVYAGAATRIREVRDVESRADQADGAGAGADEDVDDADADGDFDTDQADTT